MAKFEELKANTGVDTLKPDDAWVIIPERGDNQVFLRDGDDYALDPRSDGGRVGWKDVHLRPSRGTRRIWSPP